MRLMVAMSAFMVCGTLFSVDNLLRQLEQLNTNLRSLSQQLNQLQQVSVPTQPSTTQTQAARSPNMASFIKMPWSYSNPNLNLYQVKVLPQVDAADCGYHAKKNALFMLNAIISSGAEQQFYLHALNDKDIYRAAHQEWADAIIKRRNTQATDWLRGDEMEYLQKNVDFTKAYNSNLNKNYFTVIDNIEWFTKGRGLTIEIVNMIENLRNKPTFMHEILLANSREYEYVEPKTNKKKIGETMSHWIALVINKINNKVQYLLMDSLNQDRVHAAYVIDLINFLEKTGLTKFKIEVSEIGNLISSIHIILDKLFDTNISDQAHVEAAHSLLDKVNRISDIAEDQGFMNAIEFKSYKDELIHALDTVIILLENKLSPVELELFNDAKARLQINIS